MATRTASAAPKAETFTLDRNGGGKHWLKFDPPKGSALMSVYVDTRALGIDKSKGGLPAKAHISVRLAK